MSMSSWFGILALAAAMLLSGCKNSDVGNNAGSSGSGNNWDSMNWDQGNWS